MHSFIGKWITNREFCDLAPRNVFARQFDNLVLDTSEHRNRHILFRKKLQVKERVENAKIYVSADDFYKLYLNGRFVAMGPSPAYHTRYNYNEIDVTEYLLEGENTVAVHTLYQGLVNRVWQSGDNRHGLILDLEINGNTVLSSDTEFLTAPHTGYRECGIAGYDTQFLEEYDSRAREVGFETPDFDDGYWENASIASYSDRTLIPQSTEMLTTEIIEPKVLRRDGNTVFADFGSCYVGYLSAVVKGADGSTVTVRLGQELNEDGRVRYELRANCVYEEPWILGEGLSTLDQFDYKSARYAELILPEGARLEKIFFTARHYPFALKAQIHRDLPNSTDIQRIFDLCVNTQKYGPQEAVLDCMEREKGFYIADGSYTALTHMLLTGKDDLARKLIDEAFYSDFITDTVTNCLDGSFMQETAEGPLLVPKLVLWHYRLTKDKEYLRNNYGKVIKLLEAYKREYENNCLLTVVDKWSVVEWPMNFRDGYDANLAQGKPCYDVHLSPNAHYLAAIHSANLIADELGLSHYRDEAPLRKAFLDSFYIEDKGLFRDRVGSEHSSLVANVYAFGFGLCPDERSAEIILKLCRERKMSSLGIFTPFVYLEGLVRYGHEEYIAEGLLDEGAWLRMLREDATTTFEGWGKDTKWNTSLFHITMSYAAAFMVDIDRKALFG